MKNVKRWATGCWLRATGQAERNRRQLAGGARGVRIALLHNVYPHEFDAFRRMVDGAREPFEVGSPADIDALVEGRLAPSQRDRLVFSFDDGSDNNYQVACWLAEQGWPAIFFLVPPFLGRTTDEFVAFHAERGIDAFPLGRRAAVQPSRGMSRSQARELASMGHRVGAHNYAHRNLAKLRSAEDLEYEIGRAVDEVSELLAAPCRDFAVGFGHWSDLSAEAVSDLQRRGLRVYLACRGLNVGGRSPRFLCRTQVAPNFPASFTGASLAGGLDHRERVEVERVKSAVGVLPPPAARILAAVKPGEGGLSKGPPSADRPSVGL